MSTPFDPYKAPQSSLDAPPRADPAAAVPGSVIELLAQTRPWVRLMAILVFVGMGLAIIGGVVVASLTPSSVPGAGFAVFIPMFIVLVLYIPPALLLWQYADRIRQLQNGGGMAALEDAIGRQKSFWKYIGILACIGIGFYALALIGTAMTGAFLTRH
jgi:hypothetical protein